MLNAKHVGAVLEATEEAGGYEYLALLARVKLALESAVEITVPAKDIRRCPFQPRRYFNQESIERLSDSIAAAGQAMSGMIREKSGNTRYELIDGERRWRAVLHIPEKVRPRYKAKLIKADDDVVQFLISGIANFNREPHTPLEVSDTVDRMTSLGLPLDEVGSLLGISVLWAGQMLSLKKLVPEVRAMLDPTLHKDKRLPVTAAIEISKIEARLQLELAYKVIRKDVSLARLRGEVLQVAKREGSEIRTRVIPPDKQWDKFGNKVKEIHRLSGDARDLANSRVIDRYVRLEPNYSANLREMLRKTRESIETLEKWMDLKKK